MINLYLLALILVLIIYIHYENNTIEASYYEIESKKIPSSFNNFKILQLSDLHSKTFNNNNEYLIKKIDAEIPDIVVMTGDMINNKDENYKSFSLLASYLSKNYDTYYVFGNHEEDLDYHQKENLKNLLETLNIKTLYNKKISLKRNDGTINLYGLCFDMIYYKKPYKFSEDFNVLENKKLLGNPNINLYNILLAHNPLYFEVYSEWGADVILSGHVHGGIIKIPFLGGLLSPERKFFPKYYSGKYEIKNSKLIVNRGLGNTKIKLRIFNKPEISIITLKSNI